MDNIETLLKKLNNDLDNCNIGIQNIQKELAIFRKTMRVNEEERINLNNEIEGYYYIKRKLINSKLKLFNLILILGVIAIYTGLKIDLLIETIMFASIAGVAATLAQDLINSDELVVIREFKINEKEKQAKIFNERAIYNKNYEMDLESDYVEEYQKSLKIISSINLLTKEPHDNELYLEKQYVKTYKKIKV